MRESARRDGSVTDLEKFADQNSGTSKGSQYEYLPRWGGASV